MNRFHTLFDSGSYIPSQSITFDIFVCARSVTNLWQILKQKIVVVDGDLNPPDSGERPAGIGPAERRTEDMVEVVNEIEHANLEILERGKACALEQSSREDGEPIF